MTNPPISVVIPAFNAVRTLARAVASVRAQVFDGEVEIIVVDDASDDSTAALAQELGTRLIRLHENGGPATALRTGVAAASHALVAFLDADDEWLPGKLAAQVSALAEMPDATVVATAFTRVDRAGNPAWTFGSTPFPHNGRGFWRNLLREAAILKSSALARRDDVLATGALDTGLRTGEDQLLFLALAEKGPVAYVHEPLALYHDDPGSITVNASPDRALAALRLNLAAIDRFADRLTPRERRSLIGRRYGEAANDLVALHAWGPALNATARAISAGDPMRPHLSRIAANLPLLRNLRALLRG